MELPYEERLKYAAPALPKRVDPKLTPEGLLEVFKQIFLGFSEEPVWQENGETREEYLSRLTKIVVDQLCIWSGEEKDDLVDEFRELYAQELAEKIEIIIESLPNDEYIHYLLIIKWVFDEE